MDQACDYAKSIEGPSSQIHNSSACNVCGNPDSHVRYNGVACNACRVFFYRAVRDNLRRPCVKQNNCIVSYRTQRSNCFACRLKKCHEDAKMEPLDVGKKDAVPRLPKGEIQRCLTKIFGSIMNNGPKAMIQLQNIKSITSYVNSLAGYDSIILSRGGPSPSSSPPQLDMTIADLLMFPGSCMDRNTAVNDFLSSSPISPNVSYKVIASLSRMLVACAELMCLVDEFQFLSLPDKLRLIQHNSWGLNILLLRYEKYVKGVGDGAYLQYVSRYRTTEQLTDVWKKRETYSISLAYRKPEQLFYEIQPTDNEIVLLRLIYLFHPIPELSSEGLSQTVKARMRLLYILEEYIAITFDSLSKTEIQLRIVKLLEIERYLADSYSTVRLFYFNMRLQNEKAMKPLEHDLFLKIF